MALISKTYRVTQNFYIIASYNNSLGLRKYFQLLKTTSLLKIIII